MTIDGPFEDGAPPDAEDSDGVPDRMPLVVEASTPAVAEDDLPVLQEGTSIAEEDTPPVAGAIPP